MPRHLIQFDEELGSFVHESCRKARAPIIRAHIRQQTQHQDEWVVPHGLKQRTIDVYAREWSRYLEFAESHGFSVIPGRDALWVHSLVWRFVCQRATACKPSTLNSIFSALAHFGAQSGHLLSTSRFDSDSLTYRVIVMMKKQLSLDHKEAFGGDPELYGPNRCVPLGQRSISTLLSAFRVHNEPSFLQLDRADRHNLFGCVMQHTAAMRFGHFPSRAYTIDDFEVDPVDNSIRLVTDWHRYSGRRRYCLLFAAFPEHASQWYDIYSQRGHVIDRVAAATIMHWHFRALRASGERTVFAPDADAAASRDARQKWLRVKLLATTPLNEIRAREMIAEVTPHSFRPGLAGNLLAEGVPLKQITVICRWSGVGIAKIYADRRPLAAYRSSTSFRLLR